MKVKELIKALQEMEEIYGNLEVSITVDNGVVTSTNDIFLGYNQFENHSEIDLRNFPY